MWEQSSELCPIFDAFPANPVHIDRVITGRPKINADPSTGTAPAPHPPYRPEIDGLRAVAVLSVVLYHFGLTSLGGGFVGVDVFFVISGFLIGGILWSELQVTGRIALGRFYLRRVRRLAPAFFAMAIVTTIFATAILLPFEFREYGKSLIAATLWLSNVLFYRGAGYFDIGAENKVLLHTWTLSVEEQFYVFLPLFLLALAAVRFSKTGLIVTLALLWAASLAASLWLTPRMPTATFYLFPFRAWELLSGVLLAIWGIERRAIWRGHPLWSWLGLALIAGSVVLIRPAGFPGWQVVIPVAGTVLILLNGSDRNPVNWLLASRGPVFVGLISYSLYLWHWPVLTLSTYWRDGYASLQETALWLFLAVVLSIISWALIERPARRFVPTRPLLTGTVLTAAAMLGAGAMAYLLDGAPGRFGPMARPHIDASGDFLQDWSRCTTPTGGPLAGIETCAIGPDAPPEVLIWGDSHLRAFMDGLAQAADETGTPGMIIWHAGCPPLFGLSKTESAATGTEDQDCLTDTETLRAALPGMDGIARVLLIGRWTYYAEGTGTGRDLHNTIALRPAPGSDLQGDDQAALYAAAWEATVAELSTHFAQVHVLRQVPELPDYDSRDIARRMAHGRLSGADAMPLFTVRPEVLAARVVDAEAPLTRLASDGAITLIDNWPMLCPDNCTAMQAGRSLYFDNNHLNNDGARTLRSLFVPFLTGAAS